MADKSSEFTGEIPRNYDECLGPVIFEYYAGDMARRVAETGPETVLELAAGTGIVTRKLRDALGPQAVLVATDLNEPMLEVAKTKFDNAEAIRFRQADAQNLAFETDAFDVLACQFGHMFFPDRVAAHGEAKRVVRSGGRYVFSTWGHMEQNPFSRIAHDTMAELFEGDPPGFYEVPFSLHDPAQVTAELAQAGLNDVTHTEIAHEPTVTDFGHFAHGLVFGNPAIEDVRACSGDPSAVRKEIAGRLRAAFGQEPNTMALTAHVFEVTIP